MTPKISIIVPAYNEEKRIRRCLDSIINQTFSDFEVICIDDSSKDSTFDIMSEYESLDNRFFAYKNTEGKGLSSARNFGLKKTKADYVCFVDSDDFIQPQMYEFLYKAIIENNVSMSICNFIRTDTQKTDYFSYSSKVLSCEEILGDYNINEFTNNELIISVAWNKLILKNKINDLFPECYFEDTVFSSNLWSSIDKAAFVDLPLYNYYYNSESISSMSPNDKKWLDLIKTRFIAYKNYYYYNENIASYFLNKGMKILLSYRMYSDNNDIDEINKIYKNYKDNYYKSKKISLKNKLYVFISYHFPFIYKKIRKLIDNTIE